MTTDTDLFCDYCESENLVSPMVSRNSYSSPKPRCPRCNHQDSSSCSCLNCKKRILEQKELIYHRKREAIESFYLVEHRSPPTINELSFKDAVYALSLIRHSLSEDLNYAEPFSEKSPSFSPTFGLTNEVVKHLYSKAFIAICPQSNVDAFDYDEDLETTEAYYPTRVLWRFLPNYTKDEKKQFIQELEELVNGDEQPEFWREHHNEVWMNIAKNECIEYLIYSANARGLKLESIGDKTHSVLEVILKDYSIGQVFNLIFTAARDTNDFAVRENIPRFQARNMLIGSIQRKADKAIAEDWTIRNSRRDFNCPQSVVSSTFFDTFLKLGNSVLETIISS